MMRRLMFRTPDPAGKCDEPRTQRNEERKGRILCDLRFFAFFLGSLDSPSAVGDLPEFLVFWLRTRSPDVSADVRGRVAAPGQCQGVRME